jgi:hypothetical protein
MLHVVNCGPGFVSESTASEAVEPDMNVQVQDDMQDIVDEHEDDDECEGRVFCVATSI